MAFRTRVWSAGKLLVLFGALLATFLVFAFASMRIALKTREVIVPDLAGRSINEATAVLDEVDLKLRVEELRRVHPDVPEGRVILQEPPAGVEARRQRSVKVWLSAGPRAARVPELVGESEQTAALRLQADALQLSALAEIRSSAYPTDAVVAQEPPPNSQSAQVALLVNKGERGMTYVMPDLIGVSAARAVAILRSLEFRAAVVGDHPYPGVPPGIVLRQRPDPGFQIAPKETISLEVSR
jgi:serine/threonine-protein kinase